MTETGGTVEVHYYVSTYCIHELHSDCRLTCKHCDAPCLCPCHALSGRCPNCMEAPHRGGEGSCECECHDQQPGRDHG